MSAALCARLSEEQFRNKFLQPQTRGVTFEVAGLQTRRDVKKCRMLFSGHQIQGIERGCCFVATTARKGLPMNKFASRRPDTTADTSARQACNAVLLHPHSHFVRLVGRSSYDSYARHVELDRKSREVEINTKLTALPDLVSYLFDRSHSWYTASDKSSSSHRGPTPRQSYAMTGVP